MVMQRLDLGQNFACISSFFKSEFDCWSSMALMWYVKNSCSTYLKFLTVRCASVTYTISTFQACRASALCRGTWYGALV